MSRLETPLLEKLRRFPDAEHDDVTLMAASSSSVVVATRESDLIKWSRSAASICSKLWIRYLPLSEGEPGRSET